MRNMQNYNRIFLVAGIILMAALFRLLPHWPNFTPIAAIALFGGAHVKRSWLAFVLPLAAMFIADFILGFHGLMPVVYGAFVLTVLMGRLLRNKTGVAYVAAASLSASTLFFLITNFAVWLGSAMYVQSPAGLISCYVAALPFYLNSIAGDLFYSGVLFGSYYMIRQYVPAFKVVN